MRNELPRGRQRGVKDGTATEKPSRSKLRGRDPRGNKGKAGCGCLIFFLVVTMVIVGLFVHPMTLRLIGQQFSYGDKIFPSNALFVPRFPEDRDGELYVEAFRQYQEGNGKVIIVEEDHILGMNILDFIFKMGKSRGIKDGAIKGMQISGDEKARLEKMNEKLEKMGFTKVILLAPEYASKRYSLILESVKGSGKLTYIVHPVQVTYFKKDKWWKDAVSRSLLLGELTNTGSYYFERFKFTK